MVAYLDGTGFLGTHGSVGADLTLVVMLVAFVMLTVGVVLAATKRYTAHRWVQTAAVILNAIPVVVWMIRSFWLYVRPGWPGNLSKSIDALTTVHAVAGLVGVVIGLVGDIAHRCVRLNPHFGADAAKLTPGVIMIDEIDLHLHPAWQQIIVTALTEAFPQIQLILTTHSPQVLSTVKRESIRMLAEDAEGQWSANEPDEETQGVESSTAMNDVMGVQQIPPIDAAHWRHDYTALIEMGMHETKEGTDCRDKLRSHFGDQHPVMLDFDRLIRFQALKRRKSQPLE